MARRIVLAKDSGAIFREALAPRSTDKPLSLTPAPERPAPEPVLKERRKPGPQQLSIPMPQGEGGWSSYTKKTKPPYVVEPTIPPQSEQQEVKPGPKPVQMSMPAGRGGFQWSQRLPMDKMHDAMVAKYNAATPEQKEWGSKWYDTGREYIQNLAAKSGHSEHRVAAVMAAFSPQTAWDPNMASATHFLMNYDHDNPHSMDQMMPGLGENLERAKRVMMAKDHPDAVEDALGRPGGKDKDAPKIRSFYRNLQGSQDHVTLDTWMARALLGEGLDLADSDQAQAHLNLAGGYDRMSDAVRKAAETVGVTPAQMQAIVWTQVNGTANYKPFDNPADYARERRKKEKQWGANPPGKPLPDRTHSPGWDLTNPDTGKPYLPTPRRASLDWLIWW